MTQETRQWNVAALPDDLIGPEHFKLDTATLPAPAEGEVLVKSLYLSFDPTQRGWFNDGPGYADPLQIGTPMFGNGMGQVIESNHPDFEPGDVVNGTLPWQDYAILQSQGMTPLSKASTEFPLTWNMTLFGLTTLTAYFGLKEVGEIKEGDVVLVSGAAGATGSAACQIARILGASKIIGVAGGSEKCKMLVDSGMCDAAIDYKNDDLAAKVAEYAPDGVNLFYDNTGGPILDAVLPNLADGARVAVCGGIASGYSGWSMPEGPANYLFLILKSARMEGFMLFTYAAQFPQAIADIGQWAKDGKLVVQETISEGLENAPACLQGLFTGANVGKAILKLADPD